MTRISMRVVFGFCILLVVGVLVFFVWRYKDADPFVSPLGSFIEKPLEKYTIEALSTQIFTGTPIEFTRAVATTSAYTVWKFTFDSHGKRATGVAHVPSKASFKQKVPVIVQLRGFVDRDIYTPGEGTKRSAQVFAENGFLSLAPDFLGYGGSGMPSEDVFEERFQTYVVALDLLASVSSLPMAHSQKIGLWGHSNGGHIALTVLEILGRPIPTTLWAPVTKPFPYSILYYTDEYDDQGKLLRKKLADFENNYDVEFYSMSNYVDRITAPIQLHQGTNDDAIPVEWSDAFVEKLKSLDIDITYHVYPGADHNIMPSWNTVVGRDIEFFNGYLNR